MAGVLAGLLSALGFRAAGWAAANVRSTSETTRQSPHPSPLPYSAAGMGEGTGGVTPQTVPPRTAPPRTEVGEGTGGILMAGVLAALLFALRLRGCGVGGRPWDLLRG